MVCHLIDRLLDVGVARFIINTFHCADAFPAAFPSGDWRGAPITFARETVRLETGGGLKNIEPLLASDDESIFVCNGDIFAAPDFARLAAAHAATDADATLLLRTSGEPLNVRVASGVNNDNGNGDSGGVKIVTDMRGRLGAVGGQLRLFTGIYCARRTFFSALRTGQAESVVEGFLRRIADASGRIRALTDDTGEWHDLGSVAEYETVCRRFAHHG
jgi:NDP-sugar pyrophosphorylase family protein